MLRVTTRVAGGEARPRARLADGVLHPVGVGGDALGQRTGDGGGGRGLRALGEVGEARVELALGHDPALDVEPRDAVEPLLVVRGGEVVRGAHALDGVAELVDVEDAAPAARPHHGEHGGLPRGVEHGLVLLALDASEAVHAAEIVYAVHGPRLPRHSSPSRGGDACATTRAARRPPIWGRAGLRGEAAGALPLEHAPSMGGRRRSERATALCVSASRARRRHGSSGSAPAASPRACERVIVANSEPASVVRPSPSPRERGG